MGNGNSIRSIITIIFAVAITACGGEKKSSGGADNSSTGAAPTALTQAQVQGTWKAACELDQDPTTNAILGSYQDSFILTNNTFIWRTDLADTVNCTPPVISLDINGTFQLNGLSTTVSGATNLTMNMINGGITLRTAALVTQANSLNFCNISNWQLNVVRIVPLSCIDASLAAGSFNDIVALQGSTLIFGNAAGTALDPQFSYQKQ